MRGFGTECLFLSETLHNKVSFVNITERTMFLLHVLFFDAS